MDVLRFFWCWEIAFFHFYNKADPNPHFPNGVLGVEFFVLTAGVFFYMGWERTKQTRTEGDLVYYPWVYGKKRFFRFFEYAFPATLLAAIAKRIYIISGGAMPSAHDLLANVSKDIWEFLLVEMGGLNNDAATLIGPAWTISSMLIAEVFILCLLVRWEKHCASWIFPFAILIGYGWWRHLDSAAVVLWHGFSTFGTIRVFLLMCCAYYSSRMLLHMRDWKLSAFGKALLTAIEIALFILTVLLVMRYNSRYTRYFATLLFAFQIPLVLSSQSYIGGLVKRYTKLTSYLGELSFGVYLVHEPVLAIFVHRWPDPYEMFSHKYEFLLIVAVISVAFIPLCKLLKWTWLWLWRRIRQKALSEDYAHS